ncbi:MAG: YcbK family protein [Alphaproteobacteria bacterium]
MKRKNAARLGLALCLSFNVAALSSGPAAASMAPAASAVERPLAAAVEDEAADDSTLPKPYTLRFYNLHTGESLNVTRRDGDPLTESVNWFLRDFRRGETTSMDPELLDDLGDIQTAIHRRHPQMTVRFNVVSSYRSPATNDSLIKAGGEQAKHSLHMRGKAMDLKVPGVTTRELRDVVTCLNLGGVGYYAEDGFIHVDTGRVRYWPSRGYLAALKCNAPQKSVAAASKTGSRPKS